MFSDFLIILVTIFLLESVNTRFFNVRRSATLSKGGHFCYDDNILQTKRIKMNEGCLTSTEIDDLVEYLKSI